MPCLARHPCSREVWRDRMVVTKTVIVCPRKCAPVHSFRALHHPLRNKMKFVMGYRVFNVMPTFATRP